MLYADPFRLIFDAYSLPSSATSSSYPVTKSGVEPFFAFESEAWKKCIDHTVTLTQVYRQKDTRKFTLFLKRLIEAHVLITVT